MTIREVDSGKEYTESYDKLALCMGAEALRPPLPGIGLHLSTAAAAFQPLSDTDGAQRVTVELNSGVNIPADLVILAACVCLVAR